MPAVMRPYEDLGLDADGKIKSSEIAQYAVDIGTNTDGKVVALGYQATGGAFIYRRSIARDTWGTDDRRKSEQSLAQEPTTGHSSLTRQKI